MEIKTVKNKRDGGREREREKERKYIKTNKRLTNIGQQNI